MLVSLAEIYLHVKLSRLLHTSAVMYPRMPLSRLLHACQLRSGVSPWVIQQAFPHE
jgi:hypothetical protein